jgi:hypothetical protein
MVTPSGQCHYFIHGSGPAGPNSAQENSMKSKVLGNFARASAAVLSGAMMLAITLPAAAQTSDSASLEGTWRVKVTQYNCANPSITFPPFWSLLSFHQGGTETETTSNPALQPGQRTSGHGFWQSVGNNAYLMVVEAFILSNSPTTPPGLKIGTQKIVQAIAVTDSTHFTSNGSVSFFDTNGTLYLGGCAKSDGVRLTDAPQP